MNEGEFQCQSSFHQYYQKHKDLCQDGDAFQEEERQVHGSRDLVGSRRLPSDTFSCGCGESPDSHSGANNNQSKAYGRSKIMQDFHLG